METFSNSNNTDTIITEIEGLHEESDSTHAQLNEIRDQISKMQDEQTTREIAEAEAEQEQDSNNAETLAEANEYLESIDTRLDLNNHLFASQYFMLGVILGVVLFRILYDRLRV